MKKVVVTGLVMVMMLSGCESSRQMQGVYAGSMLGGVFGSAIGGLMEGPRGSDAGKALGMIIGGAVGAAATAPKTTDGNNAASARDTDSYNRRRSAKVVRPTVTPAVPQGYADLKVENLRFVDENNNRALDAGERARLVFEVRNYGTRTLHNVAPIIAVAGTKQVMVSPTAIIDAIAPGRAVRYTAELYGKPRLRRGRAQFTLSFAVGKLVYTVRTFELETR